MKSSVLMTDKKKLVKCYYLRVFDPPTRAPHLKRRARCTKGAEAPPFLWEKGAPANFKIPKILTEKSFGIGIYIFRFSFLSIDH